MRTPGFGMIKVHDLVYQNFKSLTWDEAIDLLAKNDACPGSCLAVCYYNKTCTKVGEAVIPGGEKCTVGIRLVNRERKFCKAGGTLMVNYEYEVVEVNDQDIMLECICSHALLTCSKYHVYSSMHWAWTRTCHSLQGSSVEGTLIMFDLAKRHISPEFVYVAMTRARDLNQIYFVDPESQVEYEIKMQCKKRELICPEKENTSRCANKKQKRA